MRNEKNKQNRKKPHIKWLDKITREEKVHATYV